MSNIFDEVDDILSDVESETFEMGSADSTDKNFNESELQDIMAEIESLEKELETEVVAGPVKKTDLQIEIDKELEMAEGMKEEMAPAVETRSKVLSFEKKSPISYTAPVTSSSSSEISFEAHGQMNLNLGFKIGEEKATLTIDPVKGLVVTMSGVELCINQEDGCKVTMDSGVKFTIPLTSSESALKKSPITTPIYINELEKEISFEFHQDAIIEGKLLSSVSTKESGHLPHPSFFKNLTKSCSSLETFFHIELISQDDNLQSKKNVASELLGLKMGPEKQFPLLLIINQTDPMNVKLELTNTDSYRAKIEQYGTAFFHYFGLVPKSQVINLNVFREFFTSVLGNQIIQLQLSDGPTKLKAKLKSLLIPTFFAKTLMMPAQIKTHFALLDFDVHQLKTHHPSELKDMFDKLQLSFLEHAELYPWHILGLLSHFKLQVSETLEYFETNKPNALNFNNPLIKEALVKLKTQAVYPNNPDVYIDYKIKTHQELQLPLTSLQIKTEGENNILVFKFQEQEIIHLHSSLIMNHFIKFILQNATGVKVADLLLNLKVPMIKDLEAITSNVEQIKASKSSLLKDTEDLISNLLRTQISK